MKNFRIVLLVLAVMMLCAVIIGCSSDKDSDTQTTTTTRRTTTTKATTTTPEPLPPETPKTGDEFAAWEGGYEKVTIQSAGYAGLSPWGDGPVTAVYDGIDGYNDHQGLVKGDAGWDEITKVGGGTSGYVDLWFTLEAPAKIEAYTLITGKDSVEWQGRTPIAWKLYGSNTAPADDGSIEGDNGWVLLHQVDDAGIPGEADSTPYGYEIAADKAASYQYYKFEFTKTTPDGSGNSMAAFQLNEIYFYTKK